MPTSRFKLILREPFNSRISGMQRIRWAFRDGRGNKMDVFFQLHGQEWSAMWFEGQGEAPAIEELMALLPESECGFAIACAIDGKVPEETVWFMDVPGDMD